MGVSVGVATRAGVSVYWGGGFRVKACYDVPTFGQNLRTKSMKRKNIKNSK